MGVYNLMKSQIKKGRYTKARFTKMANVFYMAGQLTDEEYAEVMEMIDDMK